MCVPSWNKENTTQNLVEPTEESIDFDVTTENIHVPVRPSSSSNVLSSLPISYTSVAKRKLESSSFISDFESSILTRNKRRKLGSPTKQKGTWKHMERKFLIQNV